MKIKTLIAGIFLLVLFAGTVVSITPISLPIEKFIPDAENTPKISQNKANEIAKTHIPEDGELRKSERIFNKRWAKDVWRLEYVEKSGNVYFLKVDSDSGKIISFLKEDRNVDRTISPINLEEGFSMVTSTFQIPQGYELAQKSEISPEQYGYKWDRYFNGIEVTPDFVSIHYDPYSQEIIGWTIIQHDDLPSTKPTISESKAVTIAKEYFAIQEINRGDEVSTNLEIVSDETGDLKLAWSVKFIDDLYYEGHFKAVWIDATTGDIIYYDELA